MSRVSRWLRAGLIAAAAVTPLAACSTTVPGSVVMTTAAAPAGAVDLALLDPGNYPTKPRPPLGTAGDTHIGSFLEGTRLANNVVGPWEVDPALTLYPRAGELSSIFAEAFSVAAAKAAQAHQLVALFSSGRVAADDHSLVNAVLRFPSPQDAAAAVTEIAAVSANAEVFGNPVPFDPIPIPRYPDSSGLTHQWDKLDKWAVEAFTAHGPYVLAQYTNSKDSAEAAAELAAQALDKQGPVVDQFQPTPIDQLKDLPIDPDGLLARTLAPDQDNGTIRQPRAQLHFDSDPIRSGATFDAAHLQQVSQGKVDVYQTPDAASAAKIVDGFAADIAEKGFGDGKKFVPAAGVKGLPSSKCLTRKADKATDSYFYCLAVADRYAIEVSAIQELDAHQRVSAQYLMLTSKP